MTSKRFRKKKDVDDSMWHAGHWHHESLSCYSFNEEICSEFAVLCQNVHSPHSITTDQFSYYTPKNGEILCIYCHQKVHNTNKSSYSYKIQPKATTTTMLPFKTIHNHFIVQRTRRFLLILEMVGGYLSG